MTSAAPAASAAVRVAVVSVAGVDAGAAVRGDLCVYAPAATLAQCGLRVGAYAFASRDAAARDAAAPTAPAADAVLVRVDLWTAAPAAAAAATAALGASPAAPAAEAVHCVQLCGALAARWGLPSAAAFAAAPAPVPSSSTCERALWVTLHRPALLRAELPGATRVMLCPVASASAASASGGVGGPLSLVRWTAPLQRVLSALLCGRVVARGQVLCVDWLGRPAHVRVTFAAAAAATVAAGAPAAAADAAVPVVIGAQTQVHVTTGDTRSDGATGEPKPSAVAGEAEWLHAVTTAVCGVEREARELVRAVRDPLAHASLYGACGVWAPHCFLLYGLPGTGKTALAHAIARHSGLYVEHVQGAALYSKYQGDSELLLSGVFERARARAPAIVVIDELDALCPAAADAATAETESGGVEQRVVAQLRALLDAVNRPHTAHAEPAAAAPAPATAAAPVRKGKPQPGAALGSATAPAERPHVFVIATTNRLFGVDASLRCSGRFERLIELAAPNAAARLAILSRHCHALPFAAASAPAPAPAAAGTTAAAASAGSSAADEKARVLGLVSERTHGFVGADLERLCREVVLLAMRRLKPLLPADGKSDAKQSLVAAASAPAPAPAVAVPTPKLALSEADFVAALQSARPSNLASTEFGLVPPPHGARPSAGASLSAPPPDPFARLGGLHDVIARLKEALVVPLADPARYTRYGLRPPRGVLLYGPSGCGKTALAMATAAACRAHALTVHATQLVSAVVGDSERAVRQLFAHARASAPCVLVIEQLEVLAPRRVRAERADARAAAAAAKAAPSAAAAVVAAAPVAAAAGDAKNDFKFEFVPSAAAADDGAAADTKRPGKAAGVRAAADGDDSDDDDDGGGEGGATQFDRILSALLTEMDGVLTPTVAAASSASAADDDDDDAAAAASRRAAPPPAVVVIATSAFPQRLDPAILRSGRLDTHLFVPPPDAAARYDILQRLMPQLPPRAPVDGSGGGGEKADREALLRWMSANTAGWTSAKLVGVCRDAAFAAFRRTAVAAAAAAAPKPSAESKRGVRAHTQEQQMKPVRLDAQFDELVASMASSPVLSVASGGSANRSGGGGGGASSGAGGGAGGGGGWDEKHGDPQLNARLRAGAASATSAAAAAPTATPATLQRNGSFGAPSGSASSAGSGAPSPFGSSHVHVTSKQLATPPNLAPAAAQQAAAAPPLATAPPRVRHMESAQPALPAAKPDDDKQPTQPERKAAAAEPPSGGSAVGAGAASVPASAAADPDGPREKELEVEPDRFHAPGDAVYLAIVKQTYKDQFGVAYYHEATETMYTGEFIDAEAVAQLKSKLLPTVIITPSKRNDVFHNFLLKNELDADNPFNIRTLTRTDFNYEAANKRLRLLEVEELTTAASVRSENDKQLHLMSVLNFDNRLMIQACGGLLAFMSKSRLSRELEANDAAAAFAIKSIKPIPEMRSFLYTDHLTQAALSIFAHERHPGFSSTIKQSLSVFGCLDKTRTKRGSRLLREWLAYPLQDLQAIEQRHLLVELFQLPNLTDVCGEIRKQLGGVKDIDRLVARFVTFKVNITDWQALHSTLQACIAIHGLAVKFREGEIRTFDDLRPLVTPKIGQLNAMIGGVIDFEASKADGRIRVKAGVSLELDALKRHLEGLPDFLSEVSNDDAKQGLLGDIQSFAYVYMPQLGYLTKIPAKCIPPGPDDIPARAPGASPLTYQFRSGEHSYYKNARTNELDQELGDLQGMIHDTEASIVRELDDGVKAAGAQLRQIGKVLCELDCLLSLAAAAVEHNLVKPTMAEENILLIEDGRHLVHEMVVEQFIPNHTNLDADDEATGGLIQFVTGPNASGKSVYLKQCGIIAYMAHCGSFVPAKAAVIGLVDKVLTRIKTIDSVTSTLSTFAADTAQMSFALRHATARSLILIDEYGKGTSTFDGIGLLAAVVKHLDARGPNCPKVLVSTHFHELFTYGLIRESARVKFFQMSFLVDDAKKSADGKTPQTADSRDREGVPKPVTPSAAPGSGSGKAPGDTQSESPLVKLTFLHKLAPGVSHKSYGFYCAEAVGVTPEVVNRAKQVSNAVASRQTIEPVVVDDAKVNETNRELFERFTTLGRSGAFTRDDTQADAEVSKFLQLIRDA